MARNLISRLRNVLYRQEYTPEFVDKWDELINWEKWYEAEDGFFKSKLKELGVETVLDIACGTGFHTVALTQDGFDVTGRMAQPTC
jgi:hypothetical protein